jgi:hypothetical protein
MEMTVVDYVLIALIVAIVVHLLFGSFGFGNKECLNDSTVRSEQEYSSDEESLFAKIQTESRSEMGSTASGCSNNANDQDVEQYVRGVIGGGQYSCSEPQSVSASEEQAYVDNFWGFQEKVNKDTSAGDDMVDRINELYVTDNNELTNSKGAKISDLFNQLTGNAKSAGRLETGPVCARSMPCISSSILDQVSQMGNLTQSDQSVKSSAEWYDDIVGNESSCGSYMTLDSQ